MKRTTKIICILLAVSLFLVAPVSASENSSRASAFFARHRTYLYEVDGNKFGVWFEVVAKHTMDELGVSYIEMQRSTDQVNWTPVKYYYPDSWSQMISTNTAIHTDGVTYTGFSGYYYRAYVTYYAKSGNSVGYYDTYSDTIWW